MSARRPIILMAVFLVLLFGYIARPYWSSLAGPNGAPVTVVRPLPGKNSISNVVVSQNDAGVWQASFDYFYTGEPQVVLSVEVPTGKPAGAPRSSTWGITNSIAQRGSNRVTVDLHHPGAKTQTRQVIVKMRDVSRPESQPVASAQVDQLIHWPSWADWSEQREFAKQSPEANLNSAIALIDSGEDEELAQAKVILERLIDRDPSLTQGYVELARVAMKTNWGPEGLHHAEGLLTSALQIKPDSANAKILMGYVYVHQQRYKAAEKLFVEAEASNPKNVWLWVNWGELHAMQGRFDQAVEKYREALERPVADDSCRCARTDAYKRLFVLLERKNDQHGMEAVYKKSVAEFGDGTCFSAIYANFQLRRGAADVAIESARKALDAKCSSVDARQVLGLAHYVVWSKSEGAARAEAMNQARIYLPPGPMPMYLLARSDKTASAVAKLVAAGEKIDQRDNDNLNALAHAVQSEDVAATRRLLRLGAKPDTPVGYGNMPVALMPVMSGNLEIVKLMQEFGADYAKISYEGATAYDFAKQTGDTELMAVLNVKPRTL
jgi:tetratricopeptide (TPR) repeat protein